MKRSDATVAYIKHLVDDREQKLSVIQQKLSAMQGEQASVQEELRSLRHTLNIVDPPQSNKTESGSELPSLGTTEKKLPRGTTPKHFELADRLLAVAHRHNGWITTREAYSYLLEEGLVTEQSGRFQVWHALSNTGKFRRASRGKYEAIALAGDAPSLSPPIDDKGQPKIELPFGTDSKP